MVKIYLLFSPVDRLAQIFARMCFISLARDSWQERILDAKYSTDLFILFV